MPAHYSLEELMAKLRAGDDTIAKEIFNHSERRLLALARKHLNRQFRSKVDPDDIVQSVYKNFFSGCANGEFDLKNWDSIWATLALMTVRKCRSMVEHYRAARRDVRREDASFRSWRNKSVADERQPTPSAVVMLAESIEFLTQGMNERQREVVSLTLQGYTVTEISSQLGHAARTVRRDVRQLKERVLNLNTAHALADQDSSSQVTPLRWPGVREARCRCGYTIRFWLTPWGYRNNCPKCGAMVGLQPGKVKPSVAKLATHAVVACECGARLVLLASDAGREKRCPGCRRSFLVPPVQFPSAR